MVYYRQKMPQSAGMALNQQIQMSTWEFLSQRCDTENAGVVLNYEGIQDNTTYRDISNDCASLTGQQMPLVYRQCSKTTIQVNRWECCEVQNRKQWCCLVL